VSPETIKNYFDIHKKCPTLLSDFNEILSFLTDFLKVTISIFMKILSVTAAPIHADRQTDGHGAANRRFSRLGDCT